MAVASIAIDAQLLVLLVTGLAGRGYIAKHRRLSDYTAADFDTLSAIISQAGQIVVTPSVLAETSNLLRYIAEPARSEIMDEFRRLISDVEEQHIPAKDVAAGQSFSRFGFADATLLTMTGSTLLTADDPLYGEALRLGNRAENFNHLRGARQ